MNESFEKNHSVRIENRKTLEMSGVSEVNAFNEEEISASTEAGEIVIKGSELHVEALNLENGTLKINGSITALIYNEKTPVKGLFRRAFS